MPTPAVGPDREFCTRHLVPVVCVRPARRHRRTGPKTLQRVMCRYEYTGVRAICRIWRMIRMYSHVADGVAYPCAHLVMEVHDMPGQMSSTKQRVYLNLPRDLVERIDERAERDGETRTGVITAAVRAYLAAPEPEGTSAKLDALSAKLDAMTAQNAAAAAALAQAIKDQPVQVAGRLEGASDGSSSADGADAKSGLLSRLRDALRG